MKIPLTEVVEMVKEELLCYENMEEVANTWEKEFYAWVNKNQGNSKDLVEGKEELRFVIKDEDEIFEIANSYVDAVEEKTVKQYWKEF